MNPEILKDRIHNSWLNILSPFIISDLDKIIQTLKEEAKTFDITPKSIDLWKAFSYDFNQVKVVICGLDPYPTKFIADGLAFSSRIDTEPKSLKIIYDAIEEQFYQGFNLNMARRVNLDFLAEQGILLTNCALTCRVNNAGSHLELWKPFTEFLFKTLNERKLNVVYLLLGKEAHSYKQFIDTKLNTVICISHPASAAYRGNKWEHKNCFIDVNKELKEYGYEPIKWDYSEINKL